MTVDLAGAVGAEAQGQCEAVVLSNDAGNYFGRTYLVAPLAADDAVLPVAVGSETVDLGRLQIADVERIVASDGAPTDPALLADADRALEAVIPW